MNVLNNAAFGWLIRRIPDWGGWIGTFAGALIAFYGALSPTQQAIIGQALRGEWEAISLGSAFGLVALVASQVFSFRATTRTQIVAEGQVTVPTTADKPIVANVADRVERKPTLLERLFSKTRR